MLNFIYGALAGLVAGGAVGFLIAGHNPAAAAEANMVAQDVGKAADAIKPK